MTDKDAALLGASIEDWLRSEFPKVFETWDGYQIQVSAIETRRPKLEKCLRVTLVNEDTRRGGVGSMMAHANFVIDVENDDAKVVSWNYPQDEPVDEN